MFFVDFFFQDSFKSSKEQHICETEIFCNIINIFAVQKKIINNLTDPKFLNGTAHK